MKGGMSSWRAGVLGVLLAALALAGCGPQYRTETRLVPPQNESVRACAVQCQMAKGQCYQLQEIQYESCQDRAESDYMWCESRKRYEIRDGKRVCVRNCSCLRQYCNRSQLSCDKHHIECYQVCGGQVVQEKVCWLNCP
jgi:hypothetical protein